MTDDPWAQITPPDAASLVAAKRVSERHRWPFYWAMNAEGAPMFILRHKAPIAELPKLPVLHGIATEHEVGSDGFSHLRFRLDERPLRDLFYLLALDIMDAGEGEEEERAAVFVSITRTWRWHHLLRGGGSGLLSTESQKGLIGELLTLEKIVLETTAPDLAITTWMGPLGSPKDFELGEIAIESKARRGTSTPYVAISSEHQLDQAGLSVLYLHVTDLQSSTGVDDDFTLTELAERLAERFAENPAAAMVFEERLTSAGFMWHDDYSDYRWVETGSRAYRVDGEFPRLASSDVPTGTRDIRYSLELPACEPWEVDLASVKTCLTESMA